MKKSILGWAMLVATMGGCSSGGRAECAIEGAWVEPNPIDSTAVQGVELRADGTAVSIGMETLVFRGWSLAEDGTLILTGESVGNVLRIPFADTLTIDRLDTDSLILSERGGRVICRLGRRR